MVFIKERGSKEGMGKEENKEMEFWTQDEFQAFLECVADKPISYYAFEILYWTGIREGELLALTPGDFNFENASDKQVISEAGR